MNDLESLHVQRALVKDDISRAMHRKRRLDERLDGMIAEKERLDIEIAATRMIREYVPRSAGVMEIL